MFNLFQALHRQARGIQRPSIETCISRATQANLVANQYYRSWVQTGAIEAFVCQGRFAAVLNRLGELSLYDVETQKRCWQIAVNRFFPQMELGQVQLRLSAEGVVLFIYTPTEDGMMMDDDALAEWSALDEDDDEMQIVPEAEALFQTDTIELVASDLAHQIYIIKQGVCCGELSLPVVTTRLDLFAMIGDRLFGVSEDTFFCEWDLRGTLINKVDLEISLYRIPVLLASNEAYYVLTFPTPKTASQGFVFSLADNQHYLQPLAGSTSMTAIALEKNWLVYAVNGWEMTATGARVPRGPQVHYFHLDRAKPDSDVLPVMAPGDSAVVKRLWVGRDYLLCLLLVDYCFYDVYCLDRVTQASQRVVRILDENLRSEADVQLAWNGSILTVCYLDCLLVLNKMVFDLGKLPTLKEGDFVPMFTADLPQLSGKSYHFSDAIARNKHVEKFSYHDELFVVVRDEDFVLTDYRWLTTRNVEEKKADNAEKRCSPM